MHAEVEAEVGESVRQLLKLFAQLLLTAQKTSVCCVLRLFEAL